MYFLNNAEIEKIFFKENIEQDYYDKKNHSLYIKNSFNKEIYIQLEKWYYKIYDFNFIRQNNIKWIFVKWKWAWLQIKQLLLNNNLILKNNLCAEYWNKKSNIKAKKKLLLINSAIKNIKKLY